MTAGNVLPEVRPLSESAYRAAIGKALRRATVENNNMGRLAAAADCDDRTLRNARAETTSLSGRALLNLLAVEPSMLDELLVHFGLRLVATDSETPAYAQMLADVAGLAAVTADALIDGRVDHREEGEIIEMQRGLAHQLSGNVARFDRARAG